MLIVNLLAQISLGLLTLTLCLPSMQEWRTTFGASQSTVQLTFSLYAGAFGALQLLYGPLSDRYGRKRILLVGLGLTCAGSFLAMVSNNLPLLIAARVLQGAGTAAGMVVGRAMVQDIFTGPERTRIMAYVGMVMGLCPPLAVLVGGQLHTHLGWRANFVLVFVLGLLLMWAAWKGLPTSTARTANGSHWLGAMASAYARLLQAKAFVLYVFVLAMTYATFYAYLSGAPLVLGSYEVAPGDMGWYMLFMSLSYFAGSYITSLFIHRLGDYRIMTIGQTITLAGAGSMVVLGLSDWASPLAFALPLALVGMGHGFLMPPTLAGTVGVVPALAGSAAAVAGLMQQVMGGIGGYVVGLVPHHGSTNIGTLMLVFSLSGFVAHWFLKETRAANPPQRI